MEKKLTNNDYRFFGFLGFFTLSIGWFSFSLALAGFFQRWMVISGLILIIGIFGYFLATRKLFRGLSLEWAVFSAIFLLAGTFFSFSAAPSVFSGRDQGSLSEAAIRLSEGGELKFSTPESETFFKVYGPGRALNFPGFHYDQDGKLTTQFPLVYTSWLAFFFSLFGIWGMKLANAILYFIFASAFYLLFRLFSRSRYRMVFAALIIISFVFSWFTKFTLTENMALALLWMGILGLVRFLREQTTESFCLAFLSLGLLFFTRLEGIAFLASSLVLIWIFTRHSEFWKTSKAKKIAAPLLFFGLFFLANLGRDFYFYKEIAKTLFVPGKEALQNSLQLGGYFSNMTYTGKVFAIYGSLSFLIIGLVGIGSFVRRKDWKMLVPFFVVIPSFIYLLDPNISADHPWMLRRFCFSIIPALMLYSFLFLESYLAEKKKFWFPLILGVIFALSFYPFAKFVSFSENRGLLESTEKMSRNFASNDLVLVDRLASGNGWSMPTGPLSFLFGKHAAYFFNPNDLAKIDAQKFDNIFLVVSDENLSFYKNSVIGPRLSDPLDYSLSSSRLDTAERVRLPQKETFQTTGKIFKIEK